MQCFCRRLAWELLGILHCCESPQIAASAGFARDGVRMFEHGPSMCLPVFETAPRHDARAFWTRFSRMPPHSQLREETQCMPWRLWLHNPICLPLARMRQDLFKSPASQWPLRSKRVFMDSGSHLAPAGSRSIRKLPSNHITECREMPLILHTFVLQASLRPKLELYGIRLHRRVACRMNFHHSAFIRESWRAVVGGLGEANLITPSSCYMKCANVPNPP